MRKLTKVEKKTFFFIFLLKLGGWDTENNTLIYIDIDIDTIF